MPPAFVFYPCACLLVETRHIVQLVLDGPPVTVHTSCETLAEDDEVLETSDKAHLDDAVPVFRLCPHVMYRVAEHERAVDARAVQVSALASREVPEVQSRDSQKAFFRHHSVR